MEKLEFEEVNYWNELTEIMDWSEKNVTSTLHICWGAQAGLYYRYNVPKFALPAKLSGIYQMKTFHKKTELVRGFDDYFLVPQSRYTGSDRNAIEENDHLSSLSNTLSDTGYIGPQTITGLSRGITDNYHILFL